VTPEDRAILERLANRSENAECVGSAVKLTYEECVVFKKYGWSEDSYFYYEHLHDILDEGTNMGMKRRIVRRDNEFVEEYVPDSKKDDNETIALAVGFLLLLPLFGLSLGLAVQGFLWGSGLG